MAADESFLARWSRRKQEEVQKPAATEPPPAPDATGVGAGEAGSGETAMPVIDWTQPGALKAALAARLPADALRAGLREAWRSDPAIRDFIGLSENSWDFTVPDLVPGFGTLSAEQVRDLLARLTAPADSAAPDRETAADTEAGQSDAAAGSAALAQDAPADRSAPARDAANNSAVQHEIVAAEDAAVLRPRRHGGALPE